MRFAVAIVLGCWLLAARAAPFAVELGDTRIGLDAPPGFSDTSFTGSPRLQELAESLTSASNRILLFAIADGDLRRFMVGDPPELRRYMIVVTPRGLERERVTAAMFQAFVGDSLRELGTAPAESDPRKHLETLPHGRASLLAELRRAHDTVSVLQGARLPGERQVFGETSRYVLASTTLMLLRGRALNLSVHTLYESPADLDWIRQITTRWIDELRRLNQR